VKPLNRRQFLGTAALGATALSALRTQAADTKATPASNLTSPASASAAQRVVKLGLIGCGWWGMVDVKAAFKAGGVQIVALCDIDSEHLASTAIEIEALQGSRPLTFKHYPDLLAVPGLEGVIIATPPQWHALPFIAAVQRGLDVYCEKPLAYDIREGRAMVDAAAKSRSIVQIGFQRRQSAAIHAVRDFIAAGSLGRIVNVDAQIHFTAGTANPAPVTPPTTLDWELWCGPGPLIAYSAQVGHKNWRLEKTYGQGHLFDWGIHLIDATRFILNETAPRSISATGGLYQLQGKITTPDTLTAHFEFARCPVTWRHRLWGSAEITPELNNGIFLYGEKGTIFVNDTKWIHLPGTKGAERQVHEVKGDMSATHLGEFLDGMRQRKATSGTIADAHLSTSAVKLAMIAYETGERLAWDAQTEQITNSPGAAKLLKRAYRAPYQHPHAG
jgi:predicted dehydrogenase